MKIQLLSDLHLETDPGFVATPAPGADLLVLAGDIGSYQLRRDGSVMDEPDWGLQRFSPLPQHGGWPTPVLFVPGNHEYDNLDWDEAHTGLRRACDRLGIAWLERETLLMRGVRFVGTTLWSDYDALAPTGATETERHRPGRRPFAPPTSICTRWPAGAQARCSTLRPCADSRWSVSTGCAQSWPDRTAGRPSWSPTSHRRCTAPTRAMV
jgi:predicted phosphodiesterase